MVKLSVPYRSQWDEDANTHSADCGPTCVAMILNFKQVNITPNKVYNFIPPKTSGQFTTFTDLIKATRDNNVRIDYRLYDSQTAALNNLRSNLDAGNPLIALISYRQWRAATGNKFDGGHFVVVTGYDDANIYCHDPLFGLWQLRSQGAHLSMSHDAFCAGWGGFAANENPNWACAVIGKVVDFSPAPVVQPPPPARTPEPAPQPTPAPPPVTPVPAPPSQPATRPELTPEVQQRIKALAAYRWAEPPDFDNPAETGIWLDNLGDWGREQEDYVVQGGDTLVGLSRRFYGEDNRWHAIQVFNNLTREGLWLGEHLRIPRLGQDNAHLNPALPHDTTDFAKALAFDMLVNPDLPAQDYNSLTANTIGIGFYTP